MKLFRFTVWSMKTGQAEEMTSQLENRADEILQFEKGREKKNE